jgi:catechol 2,3-dioxygenase-like lactoylglutathione lyase family enzyme
MPQRIGLVSLVVLNYDDAIAFYVQKLGFTLVEDRILPAQRKRWVVVAPPGADAAHLLLAQASTDAQVSRVGDQTGGRVAFFLHTDDFWRDFNLYKARGVVFIREPKVESYGTVAVFADLYGNLWDLLEPTPATISDET